MPYQAETFESGAAGALAAQTTDLGTWSAQAGGANPRIDIYADSLMEGVNSVGFFDTGAGPTTPGGVELVLPAAISSAVKNRIVYRFLIGTGNTGSVDTMPFIGLCNGGMDLVAFSTDAFDVAFHYNAGLTHVEISIYDQLNAAGDHFDTGVAGGVEGELEIIDQGAGVYDVYVNGGLLVPNRQMFTGNETITNWYFGTGGVVPPDTFRFDTFDFTVLLDAAFAIGIADDLAIAGLRRDDPQVTRQLRNLGAVQRRIQRRLQLPPV